MDEVCPQRIVILSTAPPLPVNEERQVGIVLLVTQLHSQNIEFYYKIIY